MTNPEKKLAEVARFCAKPKSKHGPKRTSGENKGLYEHDWVDLVKTIYWIDHQQKMDMQAAKDIAKQLGREFPRSDWDNTVNKPGAHQRILEIIEAALGANTPSQQDSSAQILSKEEAHAQEVEDTQDTEGKN